MKTQGSFNYKVNGESKTKEEIDSMDLSNMNCTVEGLTISYSFPRKNDTIREKVLNSALDIQKSHILEIYNLTQSEGLRVISAKTLEELVKIVKEMQLECIENFYDVMVGAPKTKTDEVTQYQEVTKGGILKGGDFLGGFNEHQINRLEYLKNSLPEEYLNKVKDDVITNSSRGEKEIMSELVGIKETEGKLDYSEINFRLLDLMANRFMDNKAKYPKGNSKKVLDKNEILWAAFRHIRKMIQPIENDPESYEEHLAAVATNLSIILDQLDLEKSK